LNQSAFPVAQGDSCRRRLIAGWLEHCQATNVVGMGTTHLQHSGAEFAYRTTQTVALLKNLLL
jgi:hypothetical protein